MAAAAAILTQQAAPPVAGRAVAMDSMADDGGSSGNSATISANDFLTLLVTEMRNQDPTTATDPKEYINQLVQVNSLQQLIGIHETLTAALGAPEAASTSSGSSSGGEVPARQVSHAGFAPAFPQSSLAAAGNLSLPAPSGAAERIGRALDGHTAHPAWAHQ